MRRTPTTPLFLLAGPPLLALAAGCASSTRPAGGSAWEVSGDPWRTDAVWHDGKAEKCVYEATRTIYGAPREYLATAYTNVQRMDPATTTKSEEDEGVEVFKQHWSERAPTENYDYDFSTATFTRVDDLAPFKLTAATQEDCGASFKQLWLQDGELWSYESVYFPGAGQRVGSLGPAAGVYLVDQLPLLLRDYPFDDPRDVRLLLVPSQRSTRSVPMAPVERVVRHAARGALELPIGTVDAHELELVAPDGTVEARYWFAAEAGAPWLHVLARYETAGLSFRLRSLERTAYWERE